MESARLLHTARKRSGLTLVELARRAGTSAATLSRYETSKVDPSGAVVARILAAAGYVAEVRLEPRMTGPRGGSRSDEVAAVLELAEEFPARHTATLEAPVFGRSS